MERPVKAVEVLVGVLFTITLAGIDNTVVSTVMPVAIGDLGGKELYAWTFAAYMLATAITMPIWGPGSDRWGRKRTYLAGISVFVAGSLACAVAPTMPLFIAARALQGIGAGAVSSLPFIVLGVVFPPAKRAKALGVVSSAWAVASVAGPLLGTLIVTHTTWRWVFLLNLPIGILAAFLVARGMPESVGERAGRFDITGSLLAGLGGSSLIWAFTELGEGQIGMTQAAFVAAGIVLLAAFVWHEGRAKHPILPLSFFKHRGYASAMAASFLTFFSGFAMSAALPVQTNATFAGDARAVGFVVGSFTIGWSVCAFATGRMLHRFGERIFGLIGITLHVIGLLSLLIAFDHGLRTIMLCSLITGAGMGILSPGLTVVVQNSVDVKRMGSATTSAQFTRQVGAALGIATVFLAMRLSGFATGLFVMVGVSAIAVVALLAVPRHSLGDRETGPVAEAG